MSLLSKKGFTLIELLVTVGIIVILATLIIVNIAQARMSGRDAKRIADVASIQLALEMYRNVNGNYPSEVDGWAAAAGTDDAVYQGLWNTLSGELSSYLSPLPKDPLNKTGGYRYYVDMENVNRTGAIIKTKLEANPEKMKEDACPANVDYYDVISGNFKDGIESNGQNHCVGNVGAGPPPCSVLPCTNQSWAYPTK